MTLRTTLEAAALPALEESAAGGPAEPDPRWLLGGADAGQAPDAELLRWMRLVGAGVGIGTFLGYDDADRFLVRCDGADTAVAAASTLALREGDIGCRVVIGYEGGDTARPVVIGRLQQRPRSDGGTVRLDGDKLLLHAEREIELRCGEASIVLTRAGKVLLKGAYVSSRSKGANRIKGAYVDIN